jgi:hypothetical protein
MKPFAAAAALVSLVLAVAAAPAGAAVRTVVERPAAEASFPFFCDWGYDWDERCYRDTWSGRLSIGGDHLRVWRAGLRFPLSSVPSGAAVVRAELFLYYDGTCVGPAGPASCDGRAWALEAAPIVGDWFDEREPALGFPVAWEWLPAGSPPAWMRFDITDLVAEWVDGAFENDGLILKLADEEEALSGSGPMPPGRLFPEAALRPLLEVDYIESGS